MDKSSTKNSYELISMSDSESYSPQPTPEVTIFKSPVRRKRLKKRLPTRKVPNDPDNGCCRSEGKIFSFSCVFVIFFCWLIILTWMVIVFNAELRRFDNNIMTIVAGNQAYPDVLQKCNSLSKDLQRNQTDLYSRLSSLTTKLDTFNGQLQEIRDKLKLATEAKHADDNDVTRNLTSFGTRLQEFNVTLTQCVDSELKLNDDFGILRKNFTDMEARLKLVEAVSSISSSLSKGGNTSISKIYADLVSLIGNSTVNFVNVNETLSAQLQNVSQTRSDDFKLIDNLQNENHNISSRLSLLEEKLYSNGVLEKIREMVDKSRESSTNQPPKNGTVKTGA